MSDKADGAPDFLAAPGDYDGPWDHDVVITALPVEEYERILAETEPTTRLAGLWEANDDTRIAAGETGGAHAALALTATFLIATAATFVLVAVVGSPAGRTDLGYGSYDGSVFRLSFGNPFESEAVLDPDDVADTAPDSVSGEPGEGLLVWSAIVSPALREYVRARAEADAADQTEACGERSFDDSSLRRRPYLQDVTSYRARVMWTTKSDKRGSVRLQPVGGGEPWLFSATAEHFRKSRTRQGFSYYQHDAAISGLLPGVTYCYEVLADDEVIAGGLWFSTALDPSDPRPVRLAVLGDSGTALEGQRQVRKRLSEREHDLLVHVGDLAYPDATYSALEELFFRSYRKILHRVPSFPTPGNHEYTIDNAQPYLDMFGLPGRQRYYSFDWGDVHFVSIDSNPEMLGPLVEGNYDLTGGDMLEWLQSDLQGSARTWKVVFMHHSPYHSGGDGDGMARMVTSTLVPLFEQYGVDLVLSGHRHRYERTVPILHGRATADGITYVVAGASGRLAELDGTRWHTAAINADMNSYLSLTFVGCEAIGEAIGQDGTLIDVFEVNGCAR